MKNKVLQLLSWRLPRRSGGLSLRRRGSRVAAVPTHALTGAFSNPVVEGMAVQDGQAQFFTDVWGDDNQSPRVINAVNEGTGVSTEILGYELHGDLANLEGELEAIEPQVPLAEASAVSSAQDLETNENQRAELDQRCTLEGLTTPDHRLARVLIEMLGLALLGVGDVYFTSLAFEVFGLSDRPVASFLPISEVQAVAVSVIVALLIAVGIAGPRLVRFWHNLEHAPNSDPAVNRRRRVRVLAEMFFVLTCIGGALSTLFGISGVRAAYLLAQGVAAHYGEFLLIQIGVATAGLMLAAWMSHPYDREWRSVTHGVRASSADLAKSYRVVAHLVGEFNGLIRRREAVLSQALAHALALTNHAGQQGELYARRHQLSLPEPTTTRLFPDALPHPTEPRLVAEINRYLAGKPSIFKTYEPFDLSRVDACLEEIETRRAERSKSVNDRILALIGNGHRVTAEKAATNGHAHGQKAVKR